MRPNKDQRDFLADYVAAAAHHEAGHALVCVQLGAEVTGVSLAYHRREAGPDEELLTVDGITHADVDGDPDTAVICSVAGAVACAYRDYRADGGNLARLVEQRWQHHTSGSDVEMLARYLPDSSLREAEAFDRAERLIRANWRDLACIARELAEQDELSGRRIHQLAG